jgi:hypothetical protein
MAHIVMLRAEMKSIQARRRPEVFDPNRQQPKMILSAGLFKN